MSENAHQARKKNDAGVGARLLVLDDYDHTTIAIAETIQNRKDFNSRVGSMNFSTG